MSSKRFIEISPSNQVPTSVMSYRNGNNIISWTLGASDMMLIPSSVRFCGKIKFFKSDGVEASAGDKLCINERCGVYGALSQIILKNGGQQVIEHLKHYNRFMSSYLPAHTSNLDAETYNHNQALTSSNWNLSRADLVESNALEPNGIDFCCPLPCGVLSSSTPIPLSNVYGLNGMVIDLVLNSDSDFFYEQDGTGANISDAYYELSDVKLVAEVIDPDDETISKLSAQKEQGITFNSFSTYYTSINSQNAIINFSLALKNCISAFMNFIPAKNLNNRSFDGASTLPPLNANGSVASLLSVLFTRGGQAFPTLYQIDTIQKDQLAVGGLPIARTLDPQTSESWLNAIRDWSKPLQRTQISQRNANYNFDTNDNVVLEGGQNYGVGQLFTLYDTGVDFSTQTFGINMSLELTSDSPNAVFLFIKNKASLVYNENGLQVVQ